MATIYEVLRMLDGARLHDVLERDRPDTITITVSIPGERIEIDVFEDEHIEFSRFRGDESIEGEIGLLREIIARETEAG